MDDKLDFYFNRMTNEKDKDILYIIKLQLESIINDLNSQTKISAIIKQIKNIIIMMNKGLVENRNNTEQIRGDIKDLNKNIITMK